MPVVSTGLVEKGVRSEFLFRLQSTPTYFGDLSTRIVSTTATEQYRWLGTSAPMREWGTGRLPKGLRSESYDVTNAKYEATIEVDRDELSDDQTGQIRIRVAEMSERAVMHKDYLVGQLLINGATSGNNSYDGVTFFNGSHVSGSSGTQDNDHTTAITAASSPTTVEFKASFVRMSGAMMGFLDDQAQPMNTSLAGLICVVPPTMFYTALEAMSATIISNTSNVLEGAARVISFPWLTTATTWYLLKTDRVVRPFIFQDREPLTFGSLAESSEEEFMREKYLYGVRARYKMTYGYWQYAMREVFTTS